MESLIHEKFRNGTDRPFKIGDLIKWKEPDEQWFYGKIDHIYDHHCEVSYGSKNTLRKFLRCDCNLDYFCDVDTHRLINITAEELEW